MNWRICLVGAVVGYAGAVVGYGGAVSAIEVNGVQAAAIELPQTAVLLRRPVGNTPAGDIIPIHVPVEDPFTGVERNEYLFPAYLDTGTSGSVISFEFAELLGIQPQTYGDPAQPVYFYDVTVNDVVQFGVTETLYVSIGGIPVLSEPEFDDLAGINQAFTAPVAARLQMGLLPLEDVFFQTPRNVIGMPFLQNKVMVVDATLYTRFDENAPIEEFVLPQLITTVHDANDTTVVLPRTDFTVKLSYADFEQFTLLQPDPGAQPGVQGPSLAANPFIGRNPLSTGGAADDDTPQVRIERANPLSTPENPLSNLTISGDYLFDTAAQVSFISSEQAAALGIEEQIIDDGNGNVRVTLVDTITGLELPGVFEVPLSGTNPDEAASYLGFSLEKLVIPAVEGDLVFLNVPVLIIDVSLEDAMGNVYLLDGDIGMNLFLPSFALDLAATAAGFDFMVFDQPAGELRLTLVPEPAALTAATLLLTGLLHRAHPRRRRGSHPGA